MAKKTKKGLRHMGSRAVFFLSAKKFFMDFNNIHSPETVRGCPDHFREQRLTWDNKKSLDPYTRSLNEQAKGSEEGSALITRLTLHPWNKYIQNLKRGHRRAHILGNIQHSLSKNPCKWMIKREKPIAATGKPCTFLGFGRLHHQDRNTLWLVILCL